jgi:hypothetical protein
MNGLIPGEPMFHWQRWLAEAGGLVVMLVAVPLAIMLGWIVERWVRARRC